ncbi:hypothetical protein SAMN05519104_6664 [Rhizobiales bacterium GAS188]|nr:hypothetical protein SAMN05519104_6664 [Rhizobiales bacterium GAS188]
MTLPVWPIGLPVNPLADLSVAEAYRAPVATEMEDGPDRMRRRSLTKLAKLGMRFIFKDAQMATFKSFVETTLQEGTMHFSMTVPAPGVTSGTYEVWLDKGVYKASKLGGNWQVTFTLAVLGW